ncbi:MAG: hypothetical protein JNL82_06700 [Myxococcales bacterium]|nr:hypothetical protein [Myxococcales bacterium]
MTTDNNAIVRLLLATTVLSVAALCVGLYGALRGETRTAAVSPEEVAALRTELAELRRSVDVTRSQQSAPGSAVALADAERRLARVETLLQNPVARTAAAPAPAGDSSSGESPSADARTDVMADGSPRYTSLRAPNDDVKVSQTDGGALVVTNRDPALAGQSMVIKGRTADGRDEDVVITVPPPG